MAGDERRQQLLDVAKKLFSENGFRGTTTKKIAVAAGVSEAMVFKHFANKDELYAAILDCKAKENNLNNPFGHIAGALAAKDDYAVFYGMIHHALEKHQDDKEFLRLLMFSALEGHDLSQMFFDSFVRPAYEFMGAYIEQRQLDGAFTGIEPKIIVRSVVGMFVHHSMNNNLLDPLRSLLDISNEEAAHNFTMILLNGIRTDEEKKRVKENE